MDEMEAAVDLVSLYGIEVLPIGVTEQVAVLARAAELTTGAMRRLRSMKNLRFRHLAGHAAACAALVWYATNALLS